MECKVFLEWLQSRHVVKNFYAHCFGNSFGLFILQIFIAKRIFKFIPRTPAS